MKMRITPLCVLITILAWLPTVSALAGPGAALAINGTNYVSATVPTLVSNYTISAWVYLWQGGDVSTRVGVFTGTNCGNSVELMVHSGTSYTTDPQYLELGRCGAFNGTISTNAVPINQWAHLAVAVTSNNEVNYYINGVAAGNVASSGNNLALGPGIHLGDNATRVFNGLLDEVQIWNRALTQPEIQANMNHALTGAETNLVAYWQFNHAATNTAALTGSAAICKARRPCGSKNCLVHYRIHETDERD